MLAEQSPSKVKVFVVFIGIVFDLVAVFSKFGCRFQTYKKRGCYGSKTEQPLCILYQGSLI